MKKTSVADTILHAASPQTKEQEESIEYANKLRASWRQTISRVLALKSAQSGTIEYEERGFLIVLIKDYEYRKVRCAVLE